MITQALTVSGAAGLIITNDPYAGSFHIPEGGLAYPDFDFRLGFAPDGDLPGTVLTSAVLGVGTVPFTIICHGSTTSALQTARRTLEAAFSQVGESLVITVDALSEAYDFFPSWPKWGAIDAGEAASHMKTATLSVQVNPA